MVEKKQRDAGFLTQAAPFFLGLAVALCLGWWAFPTLLFSEHPQPVAFTHKSHLEDAGQDCADCHFFREDGSFSGLPSLEQCAECHVSSIGDSKAEEDFVQNFVEPERPIPWRVHQKQPDNVFFSHAAHTAATCSPCHMEYDPDDGENKPDALCSQCHLSLEELDKLPPYKENRLTGYSKTTMKMQQCEACHANPEHYGTTNANNACYTCHK
ncbi:MAG: cytochrome c family protein [Desulfovibrionaceae bacterium]|nr:cytochrome c family protein [Desulfovibrionaceae bacterium]